MDYLLTKSFAWIEGRAHKHLPKGTVLQGGKDDAIISKAFSMGGQLKPLEVDEAGLRTDGPTLEEYVEAGYKAENYPPDGYAPRVDEKKTEETKGKKK